MRAGWSCMTAGCIFTTEDCDGGNRHRQNEYADFAFGGVLLPRFETPLVPRNSISGRALVAVVAIMTFLASLTTGAAVLISKAAGEWQSDIAREVTIQVVPAPGRDLDAAVDKAASVARASPVLWKCGLIQERNAPSCSSHGSGAGFPQRVARATPDCGQDRSGRNARPCAIETCAGRSGSGCRAR